MRTEDTIWLPTSDVTRATSHRGAGARGESTVSKHGPARETAFVGRLSRRVGLQGPEQ